MALRAYLSRRLAARSCAALLSTLLAACPADSEQRAATPAQVALPTLAPLIKQILPAVVAVSCAKRSGRDQPPAGPGAGFPEAPLPVSETGTGVIVDADLGLIVTGHHVVDKSDSIRVALSDGRRLVAVVVATSEVDDLAILRIAPGGLTSLELGEASKLKTGDFVLAVGNRFGRGQATSFGIVSAMHRSFPGIGNADLIETDARIEHGDSGGPLINVRGELIGINVAKSGRPDAAGLGFAVPADAVRALLTRAAERLI
jgi:S1-C subfamily serine protease